MKTYKELLREIDYLKCCLSLDEYVYAACIGVSGTNVKILGCVKFLNGIDHWRSREKMFKNFSCEKYWALVEKDVYEKFKKGKSSFVVK
tara:strand:+ start:150 stop:416 length:267 start_codon:yes stop_codon:yes gene_type:complete